MGNSPGYTPSAATSPKRPTERSAVRASKAVYGGGRPGTASRQVDGGHRIVDGLLDQVRDARLAEFVPDRHARPLERPGGVDLHPGGGLLGLGGKVGEAPVRRVNAVVGRNQHGEDVLVEIAAAEQPEGLERLHTGEERLGVKDPGEVAGLVEAADGGPVELVVNDGAWGRAGDPGAREARKGVPGLGVDHAVRGGG